MTSAQDAKPRYFFGPTLARRVNLFAFPRTGAHFFRYCTVGLFDLVQFPGPNLDNPEAASRQAELDPDILYALTLREDGSPYHPVHFDAAATGQHGAPAYLGHPVVILTREPLAAAYSLYRVTRDRPGFAPHPADAAAWLTQHLRRHASFLDAAAGVLRDHGERALVVRYEELRASPEPLRRLVALVGVKPKLRPELVHKLTRFDTFARPGPRTFYREADNDAWRRDEPFAAAVAAADVPDFSAYPFVERPRP